MASKKDLVEAYQFSRRRLVTAFVSGAPGGREVEPPRPARTIVGGLALAVLMIAGAAIAGMLAPRDPADWKQVGLILSKETGAVYVITDADAEPLVLHPVINITSARLIVGSGDPKVISQDTIDDQRIGNAIGILDAPADLPSTKRLVDDGWTACTREGNGIRVHLGAEPLAAEVANGGALVVSKQDQQLYLIATSPDLGDPSQPPRAHRYLVPRGPNVDGMLNQLNMPSSVEAVPVAEEWLALFPAGGDLSFAAFGVTGVGGAPKGSSLPPGAKVGDLVTTRGNESYLLTARGPLPLSRFATAVWHGTRPANANLHTDAPQPLGQYPGRDYEKALWPKDELTQVRGEICGLLRPREGDIPVVQLATTTDDDASSAGVADDVVSRQIDAGYGAHVLAAGWGDADQGQPVLIDAKGRAYPLDGPDASEKLGYGRHKVRVVPSSWVELFENGVALSEDAARRAPAQEAP